MKYKKLHIPIAISTKIHEGEILIENRVAENFGITKKDIKRGENPIYVIGIRYPVSSFDNIRLLRIKGISYINKISCEDAMYIGSEVEDYDNYGDMIMLVGPIMKNELISFIFFKDKLVNIEGIDEEKRG